MATITGADLIEQTRNAINAERAKILAFLNEWGITEMPANVEEQLNKCRFLTGQELAEGLARANRKAEMHYHAQHAKGRIERKKPPMTPEELAKFEAFKKTQAEKKAADKKEKEERETRLATQVTDTQAAAKARTVARMVSEVVQKTGGVKPKPQLKLPVWSDPKAQAERVDKYSWCVPGSFRQDPEHDTGTLVDIKCTVDGCNKTRTIHLADLFQVKKCDEHKGK